MNTSKQINWNAFKARFNENPTAAFEMMTYLLFLSETGNRYGLFRFKNHPGLETAPVMFNNQLTGFQSKFFDGKIDKDQIIHSLETAVANYPNLQKCYVYINIEPGANYKNSGKNGGKRGGKNGSKQIAGKPAYMKVVEAKAKKLGIEIEWREPGHIEPQLVLPENDYIYDIYFGTENSMSALLDELRIQSELPLHAIEDQVIFNGKPKRFDRSEIKAKIEASFQPGQITIVSGEGGSGKTALIKNIYNEHAHEWPIYIFRASAMNVSNANDLFRLDHNFSLRQFIDANADEPRKIFIIDSAERLADINDREVLQELLLRLLEARWSLLFVTRTVFLAPLSSLLKDALGFESTVIDIPLLSQQELTDFATEHAIRLPDNERFRWRLCNLFYLGEFLKYYNRINLLGSYREFVDKLWEQRIQGNPSKNELCSLRDNCLVELARLRSNSGAFFVSGDGRSPEALYALRQDEIIGLDRQHNRYFITHDIYEEWALQKLVERTWRNAESATTFFEEIGDSLPMRRAFRMWLLEEIQEYKTRLPRIISDVLAGPALPQLWIEETLVAVLLSDNASLFFSQFGGLIQANGFELLKQILFLLRIACVRPDGIRTEVPAGSGWDAAIDYVYQTRSTFFASNPEHVLPILKAWSLAHREGDSTRKAGEMAYSVIDRALSAQHYVSGELDKEFRDVMFCCAHEIHEELKGILHRILDEPLPRQCYVLRGIAKEILENPCLEANNVIREFPEEVIALCEKFWIETPDHKEEEDSEYNRGGDRIPVFCSFHEPSRYGLTTSAENDYFPPSANQTPIKTLLNVSPKSTINFIIRLVNHFVETYVGSGFDSSIEEVEIKFDADIVSQYHSDSLWQCYRGTGSPVLPNLLRSIHMALETWLLDIAGHFGVNAISGILVRLLKESRSSSLTAVVASLILRYSPELVELALPVISQPLFIDADMRRYIQESQARMLAGMGRGLRKIYDILHYDERVKSNNLPFRSKTLQQLILEYQNSPIEGWSAAEREALKLKIFDIIDGFKADPAVMDRMSHMVECMDARNLKMDVIERRGDNLVVQFSPIHESEISLRKAGEAKRQLEETTKYSTLRLWSSSDSYPHQPSAEEEAFSRDPESVVAKIRELAADTGHAASPVADLDSALPQTAASKLLREFAGQLSAESIEYCCRLVLAGYSRVCDEGYYHQAEDGVKESAMALPYALQHSPEDADDIMLTMAASMVRTNTGHGYRRISEYIPAALSRSTLWNTRPEIAESILGCFIALQKAADVNPSAPFEKIEEYRGKAFTIDLDGIDYSDIFMMESLFCSLPTATDNPRVLRLYSRFFEEMPVRMFRKLKRDVDSDEKWYAEEAFIEIRHKIFDHIAQFLMSLGSKEEAVRYLELLTPKMDYGDKLARLLTSVIMSADRLNRPDYFHSIWESLFPVVDSIVSGAQSLHQDELIRTYMLAEDYWRGSQPWHSFTPRVAALFKRAAANWAVSDTTLYAISRTFYTIGSLCCEDGLESLAIAIKARSSLPLNNPAALSYMEKFMTRFCLQHSRAIREDRRLKATVRDILTYMIEQGSATAYRQRDLL